MNCESGRRSNRWYYDGVPSLHILTGAGNPMLRKKAATIPRVTKKIVALAEDMLETMAAASGVGLAAPQVGQSIRLCLVPLEGKLKALVNPQITWRGPETRIDEEGCLSLPDVWLPVERAVEVALAYTDLKGKPQERHLRDFEARVVQHEIDHLDGILIVDYRAKPL
ncbi:MAG: peptide deformylase [Candidatus Peregrinibacteria bacterium Greene0416_19]|nr:MAG: peptide deformylase [Candidatus Peregrinibacteria bacterium Greene0416_19]